MNIEVPIGGELNTEEIIPNVGLPAKPQAIVVTRASGVLRGNEVCEVVMLSPKRDGNSS